MLTPISISFSGDGKPYCPRPIIESASDAKTGDPDLDAEVEKYCAAIGVKAGPVKNAVAKAHLRAKAKFGSDVATEPDELDNEESVSTFLVGEHLRSVDTERQYREGAPFAKKRRLKIAFTEAGRNPIAGVMRELDEHTPMNGVAKIGGHTPLREVKSAKGTARVVVIREGPGSSGYYPAETLAAAVSLVNGVQSYFDHPTPTEDREQPGRSVRTLAGWFSDAALIDYVDPERGRCKAIEATFNPEVGNEAILSKLRTCVEFARKYPSKSYVGWSINASGDSSGEMNGQARVDRISEIISIDLVTQAGAGGRTLDFSETFKRARAKLSAAA